MQEQYNRAKVKYKVQYSTAQYYVYIHIDVYVYYNIIQEAKCREIF